MTVTDMPQSKDSVAGSHLDQLREVIARAARLLPEQGPISAFVHHNTLHAFEHLPFEEAVLQGSRQLGCHPFLSEARYLQEIERGRIRPVDLDQELRNELGDQADGSIASLGTRFELRSAMLRYPLRVGPVHELRWFIEETGALKSFRDEVPRQLRQRMIAETKRWVMRELQRESPNHESSRDEWPSSRLLDPVLEMFNPTDVDHWCDATWESVSLHLLWKTCCEGLEQAPETLAPDFVRHQDFLLEATGADSDDLVHEVLIRFCAAFSDQGFAPWSLPGREDGMYRAFLDHCLHGGIGPSRWLRPLPALARQFIAEGRSPLESLDESLRAMGVAAEELESFLGQTLLALRGWAGMIRQMEMRSDRVASAVQPGCLEEFLAVRLLLDRLALSHMLKESALDVSLAEMRSTAVASLRRPDVAKGLQDALLVFQLAQLLGWTAETLYRLSSAEWTALRLEIEAFPGTERRRIQHRAYERALRVQALDAIAAHARKSSLADASSAPSRPAFQVICCIDDREESFRRHLEEVAPHCETLGAAGFFGVAMYYRGAADARYQPLCPVIIQPKHHVAEEVVYSLEQSAAIRRKRRQRLGAVTRGVHLGSRTVAGGWLAGLLGSLASIPLVMRILFPRMTSRIRSLLGEVVRPPTVTQLRIEREGATPGPREHEIGYTVAEMADIVERLLYDIGLAGRTSRLVIVTGHGSSSLNNPHEAAYDCGACGGGRGGPNARAFALMANDLRVRELVAARGLNIPEDTVFLGAYHNTCDDSLVFYDLDRLPPSHRVDYERSLDAMNEARRRNAHERCRRFQSAPLDLSTAAALRHVENRAADLSQVRPECGHATNAICYVGRRKWTRGLFLDRRAFLQSYDPGQDDDESSILTRILQAVIPVCGGINLEYYFSYVDSVGYGCGTKLPHNIASLLGVMDGAASDLRPGLPWQMVEIHEPVRLLFVIESSPAAVELILSRNDGLARLCYGGWVQLAVIEPRSRRLYLMQDREFEEYQAESDELPEVDSSLEWYRGWRDHLGFASVRSGQ